MNNQLKHSLDRIIEEKAHGLSGEISSKLNQSRQVALNQPQYKWYKSVLWFVPIAASLVLALYVLMPLSNNNTMPEFENDTVTLNTEINLAEEIDLSEDLDFYLWLAQDESIKI